MSRTFKGSKPIGWEPWSNLKERQEQEADAKLHELDAPEDDWLLDDTASCYCDSCRGWEPDRHEEHYSILGDYITIVVPGNLTFRKEAP